MSDTTGTMIKQSISGFHIAGYSVKKTKDGEKIKLILEANVDDVGAGENDSGKVMSSLTNHLASDIEVGLSLFVRQ